MSQTLADVGEFAVIAAMTSRLPDTRGAEVGPGDDAAVVHVSDGRAVVSCDMYVEGVHFRTDWASGEQIGQRVAIAAMADIAAMGAVPTALVVGLSAPPNTPSSLVGDIGAGIGAAAADLGAGIVGGDVTSSDRLTIAVTVIGDLRGMRAVLRSGAQPGDTVALAGRVGWSAAGLAVLSRGFRSPAVVVDAYRVPEPPLTAGPIAAAMGATAMTDVSDGLLADLGHIARRSQVRIDVTSSALAVPPRLAEVASALGKDPMAWLLTGGEDHALVATFPAGRDLPEPWQAVGRVLACPEDAPASPEEGPDVVRVTVDGAAFEGQQGFEHFR